MMCRMSLVTPEAIHKACFHPTAVFGAPAAAAARRHRAQPVAREDRARDRHRRVARLGHHRISRRRKLDQAAACGLVGAIGHPRRAARGSRIHRPEHGARRSSRILQGVRAVEDAELLAAARRARHALRARDDRVQALCLRDDDAAVHRLRDRAPRMGVRPTTSLAWCARWARGPCIVCGSRSRSSTRRPTAMPENSRRPIASPPAFIDGKAGFEQFTDERVHDKDLRALAAKVSYVIDPNDEYPRNFTGHIRATLKDGRRARSAEAAYARRRARAADAATKFSPSSTTTRIRRLDARARR